MLFVISVWIEILVLILILILILTRVLAAGVVCGIITIIIIIVVITVHINICAVVIDAVARESHWQTDSINIPQGSVPNAIAHAIHVLCQHSGAAVIVDYIQV